MKYVESDQTCAAPHGCAHPVRTFAATTRLARSAITHLASAVAAMVLVACGGGGSNSPTPTPTPTPTPPATYSVGGTASGLSGSGLVLQDNAGDDLAVSANGAFAFSSPLTAGSAYQVSVKSQPGSPAQVCSVVEGSGTVATASVTSVVVTCTNSAAYTIGGTVSGLTGIGLVLQDSGADDLAVTAAGAFTFGTPLASGAAYQVSVKTQPSNPAQTCAVVGGNGTVGVASVADVSVSCVAADTDTRPLHLTLNVAPNAAMGALVPYSVTETQGIALTGLTWYFDSVAGGHDHPAITNGKLQVWNAPGVHSVRVVATASNGRSAEATATIGAVSAPLASGEFHSCALTLDQRVECWGTGGSGELGNGATSNQGAPVIVTGLNGARGLAAGEGHSCALTDTLTVVCWGDNGSGELGNAATANGHSASPVPVDDLHNVVGLAAGRYHTCALMGDGSVACFGQNTESELGSGTAATKSVAPVTIAGLSNVVAISAGRGYFTCALKADTTVACWGDNGSGQLGSGSTAVKAFASPQTVLTATGAPLNRVLALSAGKNHSCAIVDDGLYSVYCWGDNSYSQVSAGGSGAYAATAVPNATGVLMLAMTDYSSCAFDIHSAFKCWGSNGFGESDGNGIAGQNVSNPTAVTGLQGTSLPEYASGGNEFLCALQGDGRAKCVGRGGNGQLGNGASADAYAPQPVTVPAGTFWTWLNVTAR